MATKHSYTLGPICSIPAVGWLSVNGKLWPIPEVKGLGLGVFPVSREWQLQPVLGPLIRLTRDRVTTRNPLDEHEGF